MCSNYEAQLQTSQEDVKTCSSENKRLERLLASERQATEKSLKYQSQLEETLKASAEETETQVGSWALKTFAKERDWFVVKISKHDALHPWKPSGLLGMEKGSGVGGGIG